MGRLTFRDPGRYLRVLTGVQESLLDKIPGERARYTAAGGVVLGAAVIAVVSMTVALGIILGGVTSPLVLPLAILWGLFILNLDRWLMSTVTVASGVRRLSRFLPRILLAAVFGVIIAEPLLLGVFHSAVIQQVRDDRTAKAEAFERHLVSCNPSDGSAPGPACGAGLNIPGNPVVIQKSLAETQRQHRQRAQDVQRSQKRYRDLELEERRQCFINNPGAGPLCNRAREIKKQYRQSSNLDKEEAALGYLSAKVADLTTDLQSAQSRYQASVAASIDEKVREKRSHEAGIGLHERLNALPELAAANTSVHAAQWALRIFFIMLDVLPVLVKLLGGVTTYDRMAADDLDRHEHDHRLIEGVESYEASTQAALRRYEIELNAGTTRARFIELQRISR